MALFAKFAAPARSAKHATRAPIDATAFTRFSELNSPNTENILCKNVLMIFAAFSTRIGKFFSRISRTPIRILKILVANFGVYFSSVVRT